MGEIVEMDSKGRILIPISIRNTLGIEKGVKLVLEIRDNQIVITRIEIQPAKEGHQELKGFLTCVSES